MNLKQLLYGMTTFVPGLADFHAKGTGGTNSTRYCYSVWLRHLVMAHKNGLIQSPPRTVGELGPGETIGIGLAALLSGADMYYGMDVVAHASLRQHIPMLHEIVALFKKRENIPDDREFPDLKPRLASYAFPSTLLTASGLAYSLSDERITRISNSLEHCNTDASIIKYVAPWHSTAIISIESVDMIYSQAVLEHVDDLRGVYQAMSLWLKSTGFISHQIDFRSHGLANAWNGHWTFSDLAWKLMRGRRNYLLNREPYSTHVELAGKAGFQIVYDQKIERPTEIRPAALAARFRNLSKADIVTSGVFIQAVKARPLASPAFFL